VVLGAGSHLGAFSLHPSTLSYLFLLSSSRQRLIFRRQEGN
jgi:hypothetical protein